MREAGKRQDNKVRSRRESQRIITCKDLREDVGVIGCKGRPSRIREQKARKFMG